MDDGCDECCDDACVRPHCCGGRRCLHCLLHSGDSGCYLLLESLAMLAAAVLACRLVCSVCCSPDPRVLHALPFNLHAHYGPSLVCYS